MRMQHLRPDSRWRIDKIQVVRHALTSLPLQADRFAFQPQSFHLHTLLEMENCEAIERSRKTQLRCYAHQRQFGQQHSKRAGLQK